MTKRKLMSRADINRRISELDALRLKRALTPDERDEADGLAHRFYMRMWHAQMREQKVAAR